MRIAGCHACTHTFAAGFPNGCSTHQRLANQVAPVATAPVGYGYGESLVAEAIEAVAAVEMAELAIDVVDSIIDGDFF